MTKSVRVNSGEFYKKDDLRLFRLGIFGVSQLFKSLLSCCTVLLLIRYIYCSIYLNRRRVLKRRLRERWFIFEHKKILTFHSCFVS